MSYQWALALALHQLGTIIWVGGMFFAHLVLRPALGEVLEPPQRLLLQLRVFSRFFHWVWGAIVLLWASGLWIFLYLFGGKAGPYVHLMMGAAGIMTLLFLTIWFSPYRKMKTAVATGNWPEAAARLAHIRALVLTNLLLGLATAVVGVAGSKF